VAITRFNKYGLNLLKYTNFNADGAFEATGGDVTSFINNGVAYNVHRFTSSGTFTIFRGTRDIEYIVVAGGGGGANEFLNRAVGGGGAGGLRTGTFTALSPDSYTITVGSKGLGGSGTANGSSGTGSSFHTISCTGGGASRREASGLSGGSGAGGAATSTSYAGGAGTAGEGNNGGNGGASSTGAFRAGGGGGGAGGAASNASSQNPTPGGIAFDASSFLNQSSETTFLAGGGGGQKASFSAQDGCQIGGNGVGGSGGLHGVQTVDAIENTGSGGGGTQASGRGGDGADGVVYIKYRIN